MPSSAPLDSEQPEPHCWPARDGTNPSLADVVRLYPLLFSEKRLDEWRALFEDNATVLKLVAGQPSEATNIDQAMPEQREYAEASEPFRETWENVRVERKGNAASVGAAYTLVAGHEVRRGTDVLTLVLRDGGWRITSLVYEQTSFESSDCVSGRAPGCLLERVDAQDG